jgi:heme-degrading monooxygenase HmoA
MFARNVSIHLKPNTLNDFKQTFEKEIVPMLRKQAGFRDELALSGDNDTYVTAISFWDSKEQADLYSNSAYPAVLKTLDKYLDGAPKVRASSVISSTSHKVTAAQVAAA